MRGGYAALVFYVLVSVSLLQSCGTGSDSPPPSQAVKPTTFFVSPSGDDLNSGTSVSPWKTIGKAANALIAGNTAILMNGTYEEAEIRFRNDGTQTKPITIRAQNKHRAILSSTSGCYPSISIAASYVTIEDIFMTVSPNNPSCDRSPDSANAYIRCWEANVPQVLGSQSTGNVGCTVRGVETSDPGRKKAVGFKSNQDFSLFENNTIDHSLEQFNNLGSVIRNNVVTNSDVWGDYLYGKSGVRNMQIYNNIVYMSTGKRGIIIGGNGDGLYFWDLVAQIEAYNSVAYNNVIISQGGGALALGMVGAVNSALYNNVVIGGQLFLIPNSQKTTNSNPIIKNNIFSCGGNPWIPGFSYTGTLDLDYNNVFDCPANVFPPETNPNPNPANFDPRFVDPPSEDWHLKVGSSALGTGRELDPFPGYRMPGMTEAESIDVSKNRDGITRSIPWNLGIY